jgi:CheY-like chemotaxis protein
MLFVMADRQRLRQVLLNLVNNAIKYNRKGGLVTIKTDLHRSSTSAKSVVRISITDTGMGINQEDVKKLFRPFERIGADETNTEGTGLGLVLAKELIEAMDGSIGVESIRGEGSTFSIDLPYLADQKKENVPAHDLLHPEAWNLEKTGTILYIEDNLPNVELIEGIIENHRPSIRMITSMFGKRAVKFASDCRPDLILLDLNLPDIEGYEVLANLQADAFTRNIPVVIISADATNEMIKKLITAGARDYLPKPIDIMVFLKIVDEWIDGSMR